MIKSKYIELNHNLSECTLCPLECKTDRMEKSGVCGAGHILEISSWNCHFGEEPPISGASGSGTIFFTHCPLKCSFCQNYPISHLGNGRKYTEDEFINMMLGLQNKGVHNINLVTPTHYAVHIIAALRKIKGKELKIPVVYNTSGYEKVEMLKALEGLVDIYMPDAKFSDSNTAAGILNAEDYWEVNEKALKEMYRQVGNLKILENGIAERGMLIRHMVLPSGLSGTSKVLKFIAEEIHVETYISLMAQYHPAYDTVNDKVLGRRLTNKEYDEAVEYAESLGLVNCYIQEI